MDDREKIRAHAQAMAAAGRPAAEIEAFVKEATGGGGGAGRTFDSGPTLHQEFKSGNLGRRIATENAQEKDALPNAGTEALGAIAATGRDIPGVEAAQAGVTSLINRQPYRQSLREIRDAGDASALGTPARIAGGTLAMLALPGSAAQQGFVYGGLKGLAQADPNAGLEQRGWSGAGEALLGGLTGKVAEVGSGGLRGALSKSTDQAAVDASSALAKKVRPLYHAGDVEAHGTQGLRQTAHPDVTKALTDPNIKPWVDEVQGSPAFRAGTFGPPDELSALKQTYKNMGEAQRRGLTKVTGSDEFRPLTEQGVADLTTLKGSLSSAARHDMPSWVEGNRVFAQGKGAQDAMEQGAKVGRRIITGRETPLTQLESSSPAALRRDIPAMKIAEAKSTRAGILSALKGGQSINVAKDALQAHRASPFLRALDAKAGTLTPAMLQVLGIAGILDRTP